MANLKDNYSNLELFQPLAAGTLSPRTLRRLQHAHILTLRDLTARNYGQLLNADKIPELSINEIKTLLQKYDLTIDMHPHDFENSAKPPRRQIYIVGKNFINDDALTLYSTADQVTITCKRHGSNHLNITFNNEAEGTKKSGLLNVGQTIGFKADHTKNKFAIEYHWTTHLRTGISFYKGNTHDTNILKPL